MPIGTCGEAVRGDAKAVARRQQVDTPKKAARRVGIDKNEGGGEDLFVDTLIDAWKRKQVLGLGGECA